MELQVGSSNYDVFINFRGKDTRNSFVGHLHKALKHRGIHAFIDSKDLWKGEDIGAALFRAIKNSKLSIAVLSERYTESSWCLRELTHILECHRTDGQIIFPIFFKVNTWNVKNQTGCFEISPQRHTKEASETLLGWKETLRAIGDKSGCVFNYGDDESKFVEDIVQETLIRLNSNAPLINVKNPVGLETRVKSVLSLLSDTSNVGSRDVQVLGICGPGGIGKTTIAAAVYNYISENFSKSRFIGDVREKASIANGIVSLQKELLFDVTNKEATIRSSQKGSSLIKERFQKAKTLLILDDVGDREQIYALARDLSWFGSGTRIIVTTRDQGVLGGVPKNCIKIYEATKLDEQERLQLFSLNAFSTNQPPEDYKDLSDKIVATTGGLPLALEVIGCDLSMAEKKEWESKLRILQQLPDDTVYEKLKTSFDNLNDIEKSMFLDAACFFIGWKEETVISIWEACGFHPRSRLNVLKRKSLLGTQMSNYEWTTETLWMHDQIRDMGRRIAYNHRPETPNCHTRLWSHDNIMNGCKENKFVEGIMCKSWCFKDRCLSIKDFEKMHKLRLLQVDGAILKGNFRCLPSQLRWLSWHHCPLKILPADFYHEGLVTLELTRGNFTQAWNKWPQNKLFQRLKVLQLNHCKLSESPDFSGFPQLEKLDLSHCLELVNLHESIGELKQLVFLDLSSCESLRELPNSICRLRSLKQFVLLNCGSLDELPDNIGGLSSLQKLDLTCCRSLKVLPRSIGALHSLQKLTLSNCLINELPSSISGLKESLTELSLVWTKIKALPDDVVLLKKLEVLVLSDNHELLHLPKSMGSMTSLRDLNLSGCKGLLSIPELPSNLIKFRFQETNLESIPYIQNLKNLKSIEIGTHCVKVDKFRGFVEMCRIGDEFSELNSKLGGSCCVGTVPNLSRLTQVHQETILGDITTERRRQIWIPLQRKTAEEGCKCTLNVGDSDVSRNFCSCRSFLVPDEDEINSSSKLVMHVSLSLHVKTCSTPDCEECLTQIRGDDEGCHIQRIVGYRAREPAKGCIDMEVAGCIHRKDRKIEHEVRLAIKETTNFYLPDGDMEIIHEHQGIDWFGFPLEGRDTIELTHVFSTLLGGLKHKFYSVKAVNLFLIKEGQTMFDDECHSYSYSCGEHDTFLQIVRRPVKPGFGDRMMDRLHWNRVWRNADAKLLQQLYNLKLNDWEILSVTALDFSRFPQLRRLDLSYCSKLVTLHESIGKLKQLVFLNLSSCHNLRELPDSICGLSSLEHFHLKNCSSLEELSYNIGRLSSLQNLDLANCYSLKGLPCSISDLRELTELSLRGIRITALPDDIGLLKKLRVLDLSHNSVLVHLPKTIVTMTSLLQLYLFGCDGLLCIPKLPPSLMCFTFTREIIEDIPCIQNLKNLMFLKIESFHLMVEEFEGFMGTSYRTIKVPNHWRLTQVDLQIIEED